MKTILLVDDSEDTRDLIKFIFSEENSVAIDFASSSKEAIQLFNTGAYNACVLDVSLPDLTGYYLGNLIRKSCPEMPIAFLTNYDGELTKENAEFINAKFWAKSKLFQDVELLKQVIIDECSEHSCGNKDDIELPEIIKQLS